MKKDFKDIARATDLLKIIANEKRLLLLCRLNDEEVSVNELADFVNLSQSALSQHLTLMRQMGLVKTRREKQTIYYSLASPEVQDIIQVLHKNYCKCGRK